MQIVIPTEERLAEMLKGTSHKPDEVVGKMSPARGSYPEWSFNVRHVAINAVMAGAKPEYLPTILAIAETGLTSLSSSTNSFATAAVINGPIRDKLNMNYGIGAMGPFSQPNAAIGRAWTMLSRNLSNSGIPGQTYLGTLGNGVNYNNLIIRRKREEQPVDSAHVQKGFKPRKTSSACSSASAFRRVRAASVSASSRCRSITKPSPTTAFPSARFSAR